MGNTNLTQADGAPVLDLAVLIAGGFKDLNCKGWLLYPGFDLTECWISGTSWVC
jgi:hypothetical protein